MRIAWITPIKSNPSAFLAISGLVGISAFFTDNLVKCVLCPFSVFLRLDHKALGIVQSPTVMLRLGFWLPTSWLIGFACELPGIAMTGRNTFNIRQSFIVPRLPKLCRHRFCDHGRHRRIFREKFRKLLQNLFSFLL